MLADRMNVFPLNQNVRWVFHFERKKSFRHLFGEKMEFWKDLILYLNPKGQIMGLDSKGLHSSQTTNIIKVEKVILKVALFNKTNSQAGSI